MPAVHIILGTILLSFGRKLYWLAVGLLGFLVAAQLAGEWLAEQSLAIQLLAAAAAGIVGAIIAIVFQRVAFALGGFFAGGYLAVGVAGNLAASADSHLIWFVIGGAVGAVIAALVMDWAIIALTSLVGAGAIVNALKLSESVSLLLFVVLAAAGMLFQGAQFKRTETVGEHD